MTIQSSSYKKVNISLKRNGKDAIKFLLTGQEFMFITESEARYCWSTHKENMESRQNWTTPLGIFLAIIAMFTTSTFKSAFGLSSETWEKIFIVILVDTFFWLIYVINQIIKLKKIDFIDELKKRGKILKISD